MGEKRKRKGERAQEKANTFTAFKVDLIFKSISGSHFQNTSPTVSVLPLVAQKSWRGGQEEEGVAGVRGTESS